MKLLLLLAGLALSPAAYTLLGLRVPTLRAAAAPVPAAAYRGGPPPGHTGGFGEPTCRACHFDVADPHPAGGVQVQGLPAEGYSPGREYLLRVVLRRPGMRAGGFQLAVRGARGAQAGELRPVDERASLAQHRGVAYAQHTSRGVAARDSSAWSLLWRAPACGGGAVEVHVAGNAADGDDSPLGDHIYAAAVRTSPAARPTCAAGSPQRPAGPLRGR